MMVRHGDSLLSQCHMRMAVMAIEGSFASATTQPLDELPVPNLTFTHGYSRTVYSSTESAARIVDYKTPRIQAFLPGLPPVASAVEELVGASTDDRGAIFTRREVVDFILDLVGYVPSGELHTARLLEPSFGHGDFLVPAVERLLASIKLRG